MPSARELLEQADALMRRNRARETLSPAMGPRSMSPAFGARAPAVAQGDFPVLTDAMETPPSIHIPARPADPVATPAPVTAVSAQSIAMPAAEPRDPVIATPAAFMQPPIEPAPRHTVAHDLRTRAESASQDTPRIIEQRIAIDASRPAAKTFTDVPVLTDAIEEIDAALIAAAQEGEPSIWNDEAMRGDDSVLGPAPKSIAVIPESRAIDDAPHRNVQATAVESATVGATASAVAASTAELIEDVRMQVLQRIDMFTDTGLREQLGERLKPIVDKASAELVATINQHVGELLRTYVAEAIERELDRLRNDANAR